MTGDKEKSERSLIHLHYVSSVGCCPPSVVCRPQCLQIPPISISADSGVSPAEREAGLIIVAISWQQASPMARAALADQEDDWNARAPISFVPTPSGSPPAGRYRKYS
jgi:hypothetical protein